MPSINALISLTGAITTERTSEHLALLDSICVITMVIATPLLNSCKKGPTICVVILWLELINHSIEAVDLACTLRLGEPGGLQVLVVL